MAAGTHAWDMLYDAAEDPGSLSTDALFEAYLDELRSVVEVLGVEEVAAKTGVSAGALAALVDGERPELTLSQAAAILALAPDAPDADAIVYEVRDHLLMGMTTGVMDVDTLASDIEPDLTGQEVQQAIEGRTALSLRQLAAIQRAIAARGP